MGLVQRRVLPCLIGAALGLGLSCTAPLNTPVIASFTPTSAPVGTNVVITGTDLAGATQAAFVDASANSFPAITYSVDSANAITVTAPAGLVAGTAYHLQVTASGLTGASSPVTFTAD
jgi:hypothetical protein